VIAFDDQNLILYVNLSQVFAIWFIPFHRSPVTLTTMLHLTQPPNSKKYYITAQNDLYQVDQFVRFFAPWGIGDAIVLAWNYQATIFCMILAFLFTPFTWLQQNYADKNTTKRGARFMNSVERIEERRMKGFGDRSIGSAREDAAQTVQSVAEGVRGRVNNAAAATDGVDFGHDSKGDQEQFGVMQVIKP